MRLVTSKPFCDNSSTPIALPYLHPPVLSQSPTTTVNRRKQGHSTSMQQSSFLMIAAAFSLQGAVGVIWCLSSCSGLRDSDPGRLAEITFALSSCYICSPQLGICIIFVMSSSHLFSKSKSPMFTSSNLSEPLSLCFCLKCCRVILFLRAAWSCPTCGQYTEILTFGRNQMNFNHRDFWTKMASWLRKRHSFLLEWVRYPHAVSSWLGVVVVQV